MREADVKGLLGSAAKAIARMPDSPEVARRLESAASAEEFREVLEASSLGMAEPAAREFVAHVTREDWETYRGALVRAWDVAYANRMYPNA